MFLNLKNILLLKLLLLILFTGGAHLDCLFSNIWIVCPLLPTLEIASLKRLYLHKYDHTDPSAAKLHWCNSGIREEERHLCLLLLAGISRFSPIFTQSASDLLVIWMLFVLVNCLMCWWDHRMWVYYDSCVNICTWNGVLSFHIIYVSLLPIFCSVSSYVTTCNFQIGFVTYLTAANGDCEDGIAVHTLSQTFQGYFSCALGAPWC